MSGIAHKGSSPQEIIGTIMKQNGIAHESIGSKQKISNVTQAVQWLDQKLKTASKYDTAQKAAVGGATLGGGALGSIGGPIGGLAGAAVGAAGGYALGKVGRAGKSLYKKVQGTRGEHRTQAAKVLVDSASRGLKRGLDKKPRDEGDRDNQVAYEVLQIWYDHESTLNTMLRIYAGAPDGFQGEETVKAVAERFRS